MAGAVTHPDTTLRNTLTDAMVAHATTGGTQHILLLDGSQNILVAGSIASFSAASNGITNATMTNAQDAVSIAGTVASFKVGQNATQATAAETSFSGPAGLLGSNNPLEMSDLNLGLSDQVVFQTFAYTQPAS